MCKASKIESKVPIITSSQHCKHANVSTVALEGGSEELTPDTSSLLSSRAAERSHSRTRVCRESEGPKTRALSKTSLLVIPDLQITQ